jgi:hypothetical protein
LPLDAETADEALGEPLVTLEDGLVPEMAGALEVGTLEPTPAAAADVALGLTGAACVVFEA